LNPGSAVGSNVPTACSCGSRSVPPLALPTWALSRRNRRVYTLTNAGRAELHSWLAQPAERATGYRDELFFKLLAAVRAGPEQLRTVLTQQRAYQLGQLRTLGDLRTAHADRPLVALLIDAAGLHAEADLRLLDLAEERIAKLTAS
jgi:Virulence activator alpha C-term